MKKKVLFIITLLIYLLSLVLTFFVCKTTIVNKDKQLKEQAYSNLRSYFGTRKQFVRIQYSGQRVNYKQVEIPKYRISNYGTDISKSKYEWNEAYGDLYSMYELTKRYDSDINWTGWCLHVFENGGDEVSEFIVYPVNVGYIKQSDSWMYNYMPSVQEAVNGAFEFYTNNAQSKYKDNLSNTPESIFDIRNRVENEYYELFSYKEYKNSVGDKPMPFVKEYYLGQYHNSMYVLDTDHPYGYHFDDGYMYNGFYKVYIQKTLGRCWQIRYRFGWDPMRSEMNRLLTRWFIILTLFFAVATILIVILKKPSPTSD